MPGSALRPDGPLYQVVEPGDGDVPITLTPWPLIGRPGEIVAYGRHNGRQRPATCPAFTRHARAPAGTADYFVPVIRVGELVFPFTTDSHLTTPEWQPGEVISPNASDFALPHDLPDGIYPLSVGLKNLSADTEPAASYPLAICP